MKIRSDFVTNSSSSSYICVAKVDVNEKLTEYFKEEFGNYGLRLLEENIVSGQHILDNSEDWDCYEFLEFCREEGYSIDTTGNYLLAEFISYTNEGDTDGDDAWLFGHIPSNFMTKVYEGESC